MARLVRTIRTLRESANASPEFRTRLHERLLAAAGAPPSTRFFRLGIMRHAVGIVVVGAAVFLLTGTGVYAYTSPDVTAEHVLYPVKTGIEHVQGALARSSDARAVFHAKMFTRRVQELEHVQDPYVHQQVLIAASREFSLTVDSAQVSDAAVQARQDAVARLSSGREQYSSALASDLSASEPTLTIPPALQEDIRSIADDVRARRGPGPEAHEEMRQRINISITNYLSTVDPATAPSAATL